jgi:hypothetical protein
MMLYLQFLHEAIVVAFETKNVFLDSGRFIVRMLKMEHLKITFLASMEKLKALLRYEA